VISFNAQEKGDEKNLEPAPASGGQWTPVVCESGSRKPHHVTGDEEVASREHHAHDGYQSLEVCGVNIWIQRCLWGRLRELVQVCEPEHEHAQETVLVYEQTEQTSNYREFRNMLLAIREAAEAGL
jgi:hypothetical protein